MLAATAKEATIVCTPSLPTADLLWANILALSFSNKLFQLAEVMPIVITTLEML